MADYPVQVFNPNTLQDLFATWSRFSNAILYAGGLEIIRKQDKRILALPGGIITLDKIDELYKIRRTERYLEIGAMVKLNQIIHLGRIVPEALRSCLKQIAGPQLRNMATIGGNLCNPLQRLDATVPMIALDAEYELRTAESSRWISAFRFSSLPGRPDLAPQELLARIRVPLEPWTFTRYRKFNRSGTSEPGGGILLIARMQKNILTDIRVIYCGRFIAREKDSETMLAGKRLPLDKKETKAFVERWRYYLSIFEANENSIFPGEGVHFNPGLSNVQILNFIESTLIHISDLF